MNKIIIAIDGHSSTGKSTIAKQLAKALDYLYVDTGAMYRAVTLYAMEKGLVGNGEALQEEVIAQELPKIQLEFVPNQEHGLADMYLNGRNVEAEIRGLAVAKNVSEVAAIGVVRDTLVKMQQQMGAEKGLVMDGRDIGTVVFPQAELKLFLTASDEKRAARRYKELLDKGEDVSFEAVLQNVQQRDYMDTHREHAPLRRAADAVEIDNSDMGLQEQFERIFNHAQHVIAKVNA